METCLTESYCLSVGCVIVGSTVTHDIVLRVATVGRNFFMLLEKLY